jgi:hypothetical protein
VLAASTGVPTLLFSQSCLTNLCFEARFLHSGDRTGFIVVWHVAAHANCSDYLPFVKNKHSTSYRSNASTGDSVQSSPELRILASTLRHGPAADAHTHRSPCLCKGNVRPEIPTPILALQDQKTSTGIDNGYRHRFACDFASLRQRSVGDLDCLCQS